MNVSKWLSLVIDRRKTDHGFDSDQRRQGLLPSHTDDQFEEWVEFNVGHRGGLSEDNPLADIDMEARVRRSASKRKYGMSDLNRDNATLIGKLVTQL